jgi:putative methyltransferase (TIGR04325 family)
MSYMTRLVKDTLANSRVGGWLGRVPFIEAAYGRIALTRKDHTGLFFGIYDSYGEALADIPPSRLSGWNNNASASIWSDNVHQLDPYWIQTSSYAVLFWVLRHLHEGTTLIDFGGSIGLTYYRFTRFASLPANARWIVVELPEIVAEGRRVAVREEAAGLEFETTIEAAPYCDILVSAGAFQYMERSIPEFLNLLAAKPAHLIVNKVPVVAGKAYWTLQNFGPAVSPHRVYNESEFIGYFTGAGYELKDRWVVPELDCYVPFHPERCVPEFTGFYFAMQS